MSDRICGHCISYVTRLEKVDPYLWPQGACNDEESPRFIRIESIMPREVGCDRFYLSPEARTAEATEGLAAMKGVWPEAAAAHWAQMRGPHYPCGKCGKEVPYAPGNCPYCGSTLKKAPG